MTFTKGRSGNPAGRPKRDPRLTAALRKLLGEKGGPDDEVNYRRAARTVLKLVLEGDLDAIKLAFDRIDGKVPDAVELSGPDGEPITVRTVTAEIPPSETEPVE